MKSNCRKAHERYKLPSGIHQLPPPLSRSFWTPHGDTEVRLVIPSFTAFSTRASTNRCSLRQMGKILASVSPESRVRRGYADVDPVIHPPTLSVLVHVSWIGFVRFDWLNMRCNRSLLNGDFGSYCCTSHSFRSLQSRSHLLPPRIGIIIIVIEGRACQHSRTVAASQEREDTMNPVHNHHVLIV